MAYSPKKADKKLLKFLKERLQVQNPHLIKTQGVVISDDGPTVNFIAEQSPNIEFLFTRQSTIIHRYEALAQNVRRMINHLKTLPETDETVKTVMDYIGPALENLGANDHGRLNVTCYICGAFETKTERYECICQNEK